MIPTPRVPPSTPHKSRFDARTFGSVSDRDRYDRVYHEQGGTLRQTDLDRPAPVVLVEQLKAASARVPSYAGPKGGSFTSRTDALQRTASIAGMGAPKLNMELVSDVVQSVAGVRLVVVRVTAGGHTIQGVSLAVDGAVANGTTNAGGILKVAIPYLREARITAHKAGYTQSESTRLSSK